ncbi:3-methyl-2-oxobutanoate hydroxymethyltransferase, partial [Streptomyces sp. 13-12-16]
APPVGELAALGVARVSVGSGIAQAAHALVRRAARELLDTGTYDAQTGGLAYGTLNALMSGGR